MRLLDLCCGAGGAATGFHRAGFEVVGVDIDPQPNYPFEFIQGDALEWLRAGRFLRRSFDAVHASFPCQGFSRATRFHPGAREKHPDLITPGRALLDGVGLPYVIENVPGAPLRKDVLLCGEMFGLRVHRHRYFELGGWSMSAPKHERHRLKGAIHNCHIEAGHARLVAGNFSDLADARDAMGVDWMKRRELAEAIPPAYTEFIGAALMARLNAQELAA